MKKLEDVSGRLARVEKKMDTKTDELLRLQADQSNELKRFMMKGQEDLDDSFTRNSFAPRRTITRSHN